MKEKKAQRSPTMNLCNKWQWNFEWTIFLKGKEKVYLLSFTHTALDIYKRIHPEKNYDYP